MPGNSCWTLKVVFYRKQKCSAVETSGIYTMLWILTAEHSIL